jgi:hypothetical protein
MWYEDGGDVWGLTIMDNIFVESVIHFFGKNREHTLHVILGGDNEFLQTVCGLQSCSATNHCEANLKRLRK